MNIRKFSLFISCFTLLLLFMSGIFMLNYIKAFSVSGEDPPTGILYDIITDISDKRPINVLVLGGDKVQENTDIILLVHFNPMDYKVNILSIPRDTRIVKDNQVHKINYAYSYNPDKGGGPDLAMEVVEELLDVEVDNYVFLDTSVFQRIIDLMGGVDYYIPVDMHYDDPAQDLHIHLEKGQQHLDGAQSEQFIRFRYPNYPTKDTLRYYDGNDIKRINAQQSFMQEFIKQKRDIVYLPKIKKAINIVFSSIKTNFKMNEFLNLLMYIDKVEYEKINWFIITGTDRYENGVYYYIADKEKAVCITNEHFKTH